MEDSDVIRLDGEGDQLDGYDVSGDLLIALAEEPHPNFVRRGNDLWVKEVYITLQDLLSRKPIVVEHLDGRILECSPPSHHQLLSPKYAYSVHREGMPIQATEGNEKGNLYLDLRIVFPTKLSSQQIASISSALKYTPPSASSSVGSAVGLTPWEGPAGDAQLPKEKKQKKRDQQRGASEGGSPRGGGPRGASGNGVHVQECKNQ
jgi:DnaJ-class molecular chaperone